MKKLLSLFAGLALALPLMAGATALPDACGQQFLYEKGGDFSDSRVIVNIHNSDSQIDVSAPLGYEVIEVFLSVDGDGHTGYWQYASGPVTNFNPPGDDITAYKVRVRKVCTEVCTDPTATNFDSSVGEFEISNNAVCTYPPIDPICTTGQHLANHLCVPDVVTPPVDTGTTTPPVDTGTSTPPVVEPSTPPSSASAGGGGSISGHRHCDVPGTPSCADWVSSLGGNTGGSIDNITDLRPQLLELLKQLVNLLKLKLSLMPHDFKG